LTSEEEKDRRALENHLFWERDSEGHTHVVYDSHPDLPRVRPGTDDGYDRVFMVVASDQFGEEGLAQFQPNELSQPARLFLCRLANRNMQGRVSPKLLPGAYKLGTGHRVPLLNSLRLAPASLHACLWLQFAEATSSNREQRVCKGCHQWFDVKSKGKRSDRLCCSGTCRKRVYRQRQERARQLYCEGKKIREIAKELEAEVTLVKKWVASTKG
jgi:hypothetical protein